jgi:SPP1 family predicted phage head-tail adaptor
MADINNYRSRIDIQKISYTSNNFGGYTTTWTTIDTVWASISPLTGKEVFLYRQMYPKIEYKVQIRYRKDINPDYRIYYNKKYFNILSVIDINNLQDELILLIKEGPVENE